eukprot:g55623.t1
MLCYVMLCYAMLCYAMLCYVMSCHVMPCHAMPCHLISSHLISHLISSHLISSHLISSHLMSSCHLFLGSVAIALMQKKLVQELTVACKAVRNACRICRAVQDELRQKKATMTETDSLVRTKQDTSPVTVADLAVQAAVVLELRAAFPGCAVVGEESSSELREDIELRKRVVELVRTVRPEKSTEEQILAAIDVGHEQRPQKSTSFWTIDPIDGTKGFLRLEQYCVALGLVEEKGPVLGVLGCPNLPWKLDSGPPGVLFQGVKGQGAHMLQLDKPDVMVSIHVSDLSPQQISEAVMIESFEATHSNQEVAASITQLLGMRKKSVRMDSQVKYGVLARGEVQVYLRMPLGKRVRAECIWDHAAGTAVVEAAGGIVTDMKGEPLDFSKGRRLESNVGVVVTNGKLHEMVIEAVKKTVAAGEEKSEGKSLYRHHIDSAAAGLVQSLQNLIVSGQGEEPEVDPHGLKERFISKHKIYFSQALAEIKAGRKTSHWSWFIFPTPPFIVNGRERGSSVNRHYALRTDQQCKAYLKLPPVDGVDLRKNYIDIMTAVGQQLAAGKSLLSLVGSADDPKVRSSLRLFERIATEIEDQEVASCCRQVIHHLEEPVSIPARAQASK